MKYKLKIVLDIETKRKLDELCDFYRLSEEEFIIRMIEKAYKECL